MPKNLLLEVRTKYLNIFGEVSRSGINSSSVFFLPHSLRMSKFSESGMQGRCL